MATSRQFKLKQLKDGKWKCWCPELTTSYCVEETSEKALENMQAAMKQFDVFTCHLYRNCVDDCEYCKSGTPQYPAKKKRKVCKTQSATA